MSRVVNQPIGTLLSSLLAPAFALLRVEPAFLIIDLAAALTPRLSTFPYG